MIVKTIFMGKCRRVVAKLNNNSILLTETQSDVFHDLEEREKQNYVLKLMEVREKQKQYTFRVKYKIGDQLHNRIVHANDEKEAVGSIHANGGNIVSIEIVSEAEAKRQPHLIKESFIKKFKNFKN
jgi:hypothetical protein